MGYYQRQRPALLLRAGRRLHPLRQLPLLGARADAPEPPHGALGHASTPRARRRPGAHHQHVARRRLQRALGHHARGAGGRRGELEGLQPRRARSTRRPFFEKHGMVQRRHPPLLQPVQEPDARRCTRRPSCPLYPDDFVADMAVGAAARGQLDHPAHRLRRAPVRRRPPSASGSPARCSRRWCRTPRCGPRRCSSTCTTRTTASSTTCRRRCRRRAPPASTSRSRRCPPTPTASAGPVGMGFRVPMLVLSPFSRGGHVASEVFDHTSQLRFFEERFGVKAPNISAWRRHTAGDLTSTLHPGRSDPRCPRCPARRKDQMADVMAEGCTERIHPRGGARLGHADLPGPGPPVDADARRRPDRSSGPGLGRPSCPERDARSGKSSIAPALQGSVGLRSGSTWGSMPSPT